jgi:hypothetical protein
MTPRPLSDCSQAELERLLIDAFDGEAPRASVKQATLAGIGAALGVATASTAAAGSTMAASSGAGATSLKAAGAMLGKWFAAGVIGGVVAVGAAHEVKLTSSGSRSTGTITARETAGAAHRANPRGQVRDTSAPEQLVAPTLVPSPTVVAEPPRLMPDSPRPVTHADSTSRVGLAPSPSPEPPRAVEEGKPAITSPAQSSAQSTDTGGTLSAEIALLDRARAALDAGNTDEALRLLDTHGHTFAAGHLGPEATVLRIEALLRRGDRAAATRLGDELSAKQGASTYAARVHSLFAKYPAQKF